MLDTVLLQADDIEHHRLVPAPLQEGLTVGPRVGVGRHYQELVGRHGASDAPLTACAGGRENSCTLFCADPRPTGGRSPST
eukprot:9205269-Pyramimonas_sp.AAC.1